MAQFAVLIYADDSAHEAEAMSPEREQADEHADELRSSGSMVLAYAFTPRREARSIRSDGITEGTFVDARQAVAGFYVLEAPDLDAALAIARTNPAVRSGGGVEVRPVHSGGVLERDGG